MRDAETILNSFTAICLMVAMVLSVMIKGFTDGEKLKNHPKLRELMIHNMMPKEVLNSAGQRIWFWRNVLFVIALMGAVIGITLHELLKP